MKECRFDGGIPRGIIHTQGTHWNIQRRFSLKTLKDFGFGKQSMEAVIHTEVDELIKKFTKKQVNNLSQKMSFKYACFKGEDFFLQTDFNVPIINVLWQMIAGYRFTNAKEHGIPSYNK